MAHRDQSQELANLRTRIRALDEQMLLLAKDRLEVARAIGAVKLELGLPIKDYQVEKDVLQRSAARAKELDLYQDFATDLSKLLIKYAVKAQDEYNHRHTLQHASPRQHILIVGGLGRMGQWLAEFFDSFGHVVSLYEPSSNKPEAPPRHVLFHDLGAACRDAEVIVLAAPISATAPLLEQLCQMQSQALIFDICSLKSPLLDVLAKAQAQGLAIASVHPMFGPNVELLADRNIIICDCGNAGAARSARALFEPTTARLFAMPVAEHDQVMSVVLGLSHLVNLCFARAVSQAGIDQPTLNATASTTFMAQFMVSNAVVHENADLYFEIQAANHHTQSVASLLGKALQDFGRTITAGDRVGFRQMMQEAREFLGAIHPAEMAKSG